MAQFYAVAWTVVTLISIDLAPAKANFPVTLLKFGDTNFVLPENDSIVGKHVSQTGTYDLIEKNYLLGLVEPGSTLLEIGANIGAYTLYLSEKLGPSGTLHAFEPFRLLNQILNGNLALNGVANVHTHKVALGNWPMRTITADGPNLNRKDNYGASSLVADSLKTWFLVDPIPERIEIYPLDSMDLEIMKIDLIKIDAERMEYEILKGARETIKRNHPILYVENNSPDPITGLSFEEFVLVEFGYKCTRPTELRIHDIIICKFIEK